MQRTIARVRSRINWLKDGDANTALFHAHVRHRKRKNFISQIIVDDQVLTSHEDKAAAIFYFYDQLLGTSGQRDLTINLEELNLSQIDLADLELPFRRMRCGTPSSICLQIRPQARMDTQGVSTRYAGQLSNLI